ncbi:MAG: alpha/beta hydrolase [Pseudomonadota bacterium]
MTLLPGAARTVRVDDTEIFVRTMGSGPPVLLLHGYPQTGVMWHKVAPALAAQHTLIIPDLPGYGRSLASGGPARFTKRRMAADMVALMAELGHSAFHVVGHDRGGRVAYRLALDHPAAVRKLAVLDIVPTGALWSAFTVARGLAYYHWLFLAQPAPLPERLIGADPIFFLETTMAAWTKAKSLKAFAPDAMDDYRRAFSNPATIAASCDDYRAGATLDRADDDATTAPILAPTLVLWGAHFSAGGGGSPLDVWQDWARNVTGAGLDSGHFVAEEAPEETLSHLLPFLAGG